jgi:hypothetical protein
MPPAALIAGPADRERPVRPERGHELVDQVSGMAVQLDGTHFGSLQNICRRFESIQNPFDLADRQLVRQGVGAREAGQSRRPDRPHFCNTRFGHRTAQSRQ